VKVGKVTAEKMTQIHNYRESAQRVLAHPDTQSPCSQLSCDIFINFFPTHFGDPLWAEQQFIV